MDRPLTHDLCRELASYEVKLIRYFRPRRIGEVIFNGWD